MFPYWHHLRINISFFRPDFSFHTAWTQSGHFAFINLSRREQLNLARQSGESGGRIGVWTKENARPWGSQAFVVVSKVADGWRVDLHPILDQASLAVTGLICSSGCQELASSVRTRSAKTLCMSFSRVANHTCWRGQSSSSSGSAPSR